MVNKILHINYYNVKPEVDDHPLILDQICGFKNYINAHGLVVLNAFEKAV